MTRSQMLKLMHKLNKYYNVFSKYIYIIPLFSVISKISIFKNNKFIKFINYIIKLIIIVNLVLGVSIILYFTDFTTPLNNTFSLYNDLLEPYIELIKNIWNKLLNYFNTLTDSSSQIKIEVESLIKDSTSQIKTEVKAGIKEGVKEIVDELLSEIDNKPNYFYYLLKQLSFYSSLLFFGYFFFVLPSNPDTLTEYNWLTQALIEIKINVKDFIIGLFTDPTNPGNPGTSNTGPAVIESPITPKTPNTQLNNYFPIERDNSGTSPWSEPSTSTLTPNTPRINNSNGLTPLTENVITDTVSKEIQTNIDAITVSRMVESVNLMADVMPEEISNQILDGVHKLVKNITD